MCQKDGEELNGWLVWLLVVQLFTHTLAVDLSSSAAAISLLPQPVLLSLFILAITLSFSARVFHVSFTHLSTLYYPIPRSVSELRHPLHLNFYDRKTTLTVTIVSNSMGSDTH